MELVSQTAGWIGAFLVVLAYILVSYKKVTGSSFIYQLLNLLGALGVGINAFNQQAWPSFSIQLVWGTIAILSLIKAKPVLK